MDLHHLRAFVTVAREGNLTRAAQRLHLTQPAVSLQLKALQSSWRIALFARTASGLTLTADGAALLPLAERILAGVGDLQHTVSAMHQTVRGKLAIGTILDPEFTRLGVMLHRLVERYPQIRTELRHGMSGWVLQQVRSGALDVGFYLGPAPDASYCALTLTPFSYYVVAPKGWKDRVASRSWAQLAALPWIWTPPESAHNRLLSARFAAAGAVPNKVAQVDQEASMLDLVRSGVGLSLVRDAIALSESHAHGLVVVEGMSVQTELTLVALAARRDDPVIAAVFGIAESVFRS
ncbi:LysR family transcriptional regulator [Cupriavidus basilensis]|uniref:LysR family transcriptional regulator n=1 Tax=Cupriavidus basilensis TaxID=68895 RepID=A0ABT6B0K0_9BURK|nr:LysR family transcriptional regulator [Cupriavidus basilensis]MDF3838409.1 LysR family transcriptional regulator [Cupriavidus basilensis]